MIKHGFQRIDWGVLDYQEALDRMMKRHAARVAREVSDAIVCVEHPKVYTLGKDGGRENILLSDDELADRDVNVYEVARAGNVTYHAPGQAGIYLIMALKERRMAVRALVNAVQKTLCEVARKHDVPAKIHDDRPGAWVNGSKIGAVGMSLPQKVTTHGLALNVNIDLAGFDSIKACGLEAKNTSMAKELGHQVNMANIFDELYSTLADNLHQAENTFSA